LPRPVDLSFVGPIRKVKFSNLGGFTTEQRKK
jgi:hypothetical protein